MPIYSKRNWKVFVSPSTKVCMKKRISILLFGKWYLNTSERDALFNFLHYEIVLIETISKRSGLFSMIEYYLSTSRTQTIFKPRCKQHRQKLRMEKKELEPMIERFRQIMNHKDFVCRSQAFIIFYMKRLFEINKKANKIIAFSFWYF